MFMNLDQCTDVVMLFVSSQA